MQDVMFKILKGALKSSLGKILGHPPTRPTLHQYAVTFKDFPVDFWLRGESVPSSFEI